MNRETNQTKIEVRETNQMYKDIVKLKEFRQNMPYYADKIRKGGEFIVFKRADPIFKVSPVVEDRWEEVIDFTKVKESGVDIDELLARL